uniref:Cytochrome c oxidase subunit 3 n=1 Tax=Enchiridium sp. MTA_2015 TaxID=1712692 RepID=A0A0P0C6P2_9PLAT|nr:cytochrome c oxidase subunit III [Enchiridium sp. MTA_2015]ALI86929.1 cytochrome c oxidase subunit III [Enchiridium sp. MTA_2015]
MHLVNVSPWPCIIVVAALNTAGGAVISWHFNCSINTKIGLTLLTFILFIWWFDMFKENTGGFHNAIVSFGFRFGMALFISSEVLFFSAFFWAYFHNCWHPNEDVGGDWTSEEYGKVVLDPFGLPLLNTLILLFSGITVTAAHHTLLQNQTFVSDCFLILTIILGVYFLFLQSQEYVSSGFSGNSSAYGTLFFFLTGFHGLHVTVGAILLSMVLFRQGSGNLTEGKHVFFESAAWYWHFVDVVWIFLYFFIYWYGFDLPS